VFSSPVGELFVLATSVTDGTRPAAAWGTQITPGNNAYPAYAAVMAGALVTADAHGILININSNSTSTAARDAIVTIGIDPAGGSSYSDFISHLLCSDAGAYSTAQAGAGGVWYYFPVRVPSGASLAAKASVNNATVGSLRVAITLYRATRPDAIYVGSFVETFGAVTASSCGTSVTPSTTAAPTVAGGTLVSVGTVTTPIRYWEVGMGVNDADTTVNTHHLRVAVGDASNQKLAIRDAPVFLNAAESLGKAVAGAYRSAATGDIVYVGNQVGPAASDALISMIAYGVGG
jgi:hypothetical protein